MSLGNFMFSNLARIIQFWKYVYLRLRLPYLKSAASIYAPHSLLVNNQLPYSYWRAKNGKVLEGCKHPIIFTSMTNDYKIIELSTTPSEELILQFYNYHIRLITALGKQPKTQGSLCKESEGIA